MVRRASLRHRIAAVVSGGAWDPTQLTSATLEGWYRLRDVHGVNADGSTITQSAGTVAQWNDESGKARHLSQATASAQPAYGASGLSSGHPGLTFNGSSTYLQNTAAALLATTPFSVFVVGTLAPSAASYSRLVSLLQSGGDYGAGGVAPIRTASATSITYGIFNNSGSANVVNNTPVLMEGYADKSTTAVCGVNGVTVSGEAMPGVSGVTMPDMYLGAFNGSGFWPGVVAEFVLLSGVLSASDLQKIEGYLAWNNGTQASLPAGHPYKTVAP